MMGIMQIRELGVNSVTKVMGSEIKEAYRLRLFDISLVSPETKDSSDHAPHRSKNGNNARCSRGRLNIRYGK